MAPAHEPEAPAPVLDYFAAEAPASPASEPVPAEQPAPVAEPAPAVELTTIPLMAPAAAPAVEPEQPVEPAPIARPEPLPAPAAAVPPEHEPEPVELPMMAPPQPVELAPIASEPELEAVPEPEPALEAEPEPDPVDATLPVLEPFAAGETAAAPDEAPELEELFAAEPQQQGGFDVVVRLRDGDGVEVGSFRDFGTAMAGAQEVIEQFSTATEAQWPFYAGRFIRPDLIVSVDVVEGERL